MQYTQAHQMGHGVGYQSSYGQHQSFPVEPRPQGYTQASPYGQSYPQHYSGQQQRVYTQQHYDQSQLQQRHPAQDYTNSSYYATPPYSYQQQYSQQAQAYGYPYHTGQPHHLQVTSSAQYGGLSQYTHAQTSQMSTTQRPQAVQTQRPSSVPQAQLYPSPTRTQGHLGYQPELVVQSQPVPTSTSTAQALYPNQYQHNSQHQHQQQHTRTVSGSSVASTPPATSSRTLTMEGAGLGLSGVTISDHARVTPATSDSGYNGISASSTVTSAVGSFGNNSGISNGQTAWSGSSDMGALHYAPEYVAKRQKQESDYANVSSTVTGSATASVDGTLNGYGNGTMYSAQVPSHSGHSHSFSTSSMESVITSHHGTGGNQSASATAYNDMTR
ncbi:hypothetical protein BG003_009332 [Podila horticola]|nr:hypothetical protein BG003_009332 [Podila horticola]